MSSRSPSRQLSQAGFTLIEVMIAMVLLVIISISIYQATTQTYALRDKLMHEGEFFNGIRLSMGILERDFSMLYSPVLMKPEDKRTNPPPADAQDLQAIIEADQGVQQQFWGAVVDKTGIRPSKFVGTDNKLSFISASHVRIYKNAAESEFAKVTYELQNDRSGLPSAELGQVLVKTSNPNAFDEDDSPGNADKAKLKRVYPLLPGVKSLKYRYYRKDKDQWGTSWDSDSADTKNIYPDMIECTIEVVGPSRLMFTGVYKFRPEVPLRGIIPSS